MAEEAIKNKLATDKWEIYLLQPDLVYMHFYQDTEGKLEDVVSMMDFQEQLEINATFKRIVHAEKYVSITKEARDYVQKNASLVKAEAYVIPSLAQKIMFNIYVKLRKNQHPIKGFDNLDDAVTWVNSH